MKNKKTYLVLGNGAWSEVYRSTIRKQNGHIVNIGNHDANLDVIKDKVIYEAQKSNETTLVIATHPIIQSRFIKLLENINISLILEKPLAFDDKSYKTFKNHILNKPSKTLAGFYNLLKPGYSSFRKKLTSNYTNIKEINILEGSYGPNRHTLSNYYDWFPHVSAILQSLGMHKFKLDYLRQVKKPHQGFELQAKYNDININAKFGTQFFEKTRCITAINSFHESTTFDFTKIDSSKMREMDKMLGISENYFLTGKPQFIYSENCSNDEFLIDNAKLTVHMAKLIE